MLFRSRPRVVALERVFAATPRGAALINRIKADPKLTDCEIRIVAHDGAYARLPGAHSGASDDGAAVAVAPPPPAAAPLDQRGTRRAPRFRISDGVEVNLDGKGAALVDLSIVGAQVISGTILKPNQRVRVSMPDGTRHVRFSAAVAWASFELVKTGARYRAGIDFFDAEPDAIQKFCDKNKKS